MQLILWCLDRGGGLVRSDRIETGTSLMSSDALERAVEQHLNERMSDGDRARIAVVEVYSHIHDVGTKAIVG
jgi:hypothetical protein